MAPHYKARPTSTQKAKVKVMPNFRDDDDDEDNTFDEVVGMANRLGLKGKGRMTYIDDHMMQLGYTPVQSRESYVKAQQDEGEEEAGSSGRWGFGDGKRGRNSRRRNDDDGDSF
jgi:hypothetical protein